MADDDFKNEVAKLLPEMTAALRGPDGDKIGADLGLAAKAITNAADFSAALNLIQSDPQKLAALKAFAAARISVQSSLTRNITPGYVWVGPVISGTVLIGFFIMLYFLLHVSDAAFSSVKEIQNVLFTLLGALGAAFTQVVNYWLGSSKGSSDKTNLLASQKQTG